MTTNLRKTVGSGEKPIAFHPIGIVNTPYKDQTGTRIQLYAAHDVVGRVEIFLDFRAGLKDLGGFDRIWLIYYFDRASPAKLTVVPYRDVVGRGLFATRAPSRPNPIGLSAARLKSINEASGIITILDVDILDGTPLLDIKPYVPRFDSYPDAKAGWLDKPGVDRDRADGRFTDSK